VGEVAIAVENPLQGDVRALVAELDAALLAVTPAGDCLLLPVEDMAGPDTAFFVAREEGRAIGIGALRRHAGGIGEVKRMYVRPAAQGRGIGGRILAAIEDLARRQGLQRLVLETGDSLVTAGHVYERSGYRRCGAFLGYPETPSSIFYEKTLAELERPRQ
jgi:putative acetyltransferase